MALLAAESDGESPPGQLRGKGLGDTRSHVPSLPSRSHAAWWGSHRSSLPSSPALPGLRRGPGWGVQSLRPPQNDFPHPFPLRMGEERSVGEHSISREVQVFSPNSLRPHGAA